MYFFFIFFIFFYFTFSSPYTLDVLWDTFFVCVTARFRYGITPVERVIRTHTTRARCPPSTDKYNSSTDFCGGGQWYRVCIRRNNDDDDNTPKTHNNTRLRTAQLLVVRPREDGKIILEIKKIKSHEYYAFRIRWYNILYTSDVEYRSTLRDRLFIWFYAYLPIRYLL